MLLISKALSRRDTLSRRDASRPGFEIQSQKQNKLFIIKDIYKAVSAVTLLCLCFAIYL
jgi:hypothetical protein